jgi:predicted acylesterase/phospholipase RssA
MGWRDGDKTVGGSSGAKTAMVLSGGGAYAAYGVGVMRALFAGESPATGHTPLEPGIFAGASAGALNAAYMASQPGTESRAVLAALEEVWLEQISGGAAGCDNGVYRVRGNLLRYLNPACFPPNPLTAIRDLTGDALFFAREGLRRAADFASSPGDLGRRVLKLFDLGAFISNAPIQRRIRVILRLKGIRRSDKVLRVIATNWTTGELRVFGNRDLTDEDAYQILSGAAAIPGLFPPHAVGDDLYVDGGLVMSTPLMPAIEAGADVLHAVYLDPDVRNIPLPRLQNTFDVMDRTRAIDWANRMNEDMATARWINQGLETLERVAAGAVPTGADWRQFVRVAGQIASHIRQGRPYRKLTIHRYRPRDDLGGSLGIMNFDRDQVAGIIERGFRDAADHDCVASECILPGGS